MIRLERLSQNRLRRQLLARRILIWLFAAVVATAAASFSEGSRYTLLTDPSSSHPAAADSVPAAMGNPAEPAVDQLTDLAEDRSASPSGIVPSSECQAPGQNQQPCCIRSHAPRAEPMAQISKQPGLQETGQPSPPAPWQGTLPKYSPQARAHINTAVHQPDLNPLHHSHTRTPPQNSPGSSNADILR